jgi:hypothetical protein
MLSCSSADHGLIVDYCGLPRLRPDWRKEEIAPVGHMTRVAFGSNVNYIIFNRGCPVEAQKFRKSQATYLKWTARNLSPILSPLPRCFISYEALPFLEIYDLKVLTVSSDPLPSANWIFQICTDSTYCHTCM